MTKQRKKETVIPSFDRLRMSGAGIQAEADGILGDILQTTQEIARLQAAYDDAVNALTESFDGKAIFLRESLKDDDARLKVLMKHSKVELFTDTDVVNLAHGSLIRALVDKVKIPKTALATCEALGFADVVKIAKSLDREAVEKWSDEKLILIGAERKPKEEFSYDLKKEK